MGKRVCDISVVQQRVKQGTKTTSGMLGIETVLPLAGLLQQTNNASSETKLHDVQKCEESGSSRRIRVLCSIGSWW